METAARLKQVKQQAIEEVRENILKFWMENTVDKENEGFYGEITNDLQVNMEAAKGSILCSRILWTFSSAYRILGNYEYLEMAKRAYQCLVNNFIDWECGGVRLE